MFCNAFYFPSAPILVKCCSPEIAVCQHCPYHAWPDCLKSWESPEQCKCPFAFLFSSNKQQLLQHWRRTMQLTRGVEDIRPEMAATLLLSIYPNETCTWGKCGRESKVLKSKVLLWPQAKSALPAGWRSKLSFPPTLNPSRESLPVRGLCVSHGHRPSVPIVPTRCQLSAFASALGNLAQHLQASTPGSRVSPTQTRPAWSE